ncbi:MAG: hypothetical protein FWE94_03510 [Coriobacteriia bacterium]|nr:hypothetical protein [Coriobacteriia bacterium]
MPSNLKAKRDILMQEAIAREPGIINAKKVILRYWTLLFAARAAFLILGTVYVLSRGLPISSCVLDCVALAVSVLFAFSMYQQGTKDVAYLAIVGGVLSVLNLFVSNSPMQVFRVGDVFYNVYIGAMIVVSLIQIASMCSILSNKDCKTYFAETGRINKALKKG